MFATMQRWQIRQRIMMPPPPSHLSKGGVRGVAMLAGGAIPIERRGHSFDGLIHVVNGTIPEDRIECNIIFIDSLVYFFGFFGAQYSFLVPFVYQPQCSILPISLLFFSLSSFPLLLLLLLPLLLLLCKKVDLWASFAFLSHALGQLHHHKHTHVPAGANNAAHTTTTTASSSPAGDQQSHGRRTTADALGSDSSSNSSSSSSYSDSSDSSSSGTTRDQPTRSTVTAPVGDTAETAAAAAAVSTGDRRVWVSSSAAALEWAARGYPETSTSGADSVASLAAAVLPPDSKVGLFFL